MAKRILKLMDPDSPGMYVWVMRGWWARTFFPKHFATLGECGKYRELDKVLQSYESLLTEAAGMREYIRAESPAYFRDTPDDEPNSDYSSPKDQFVLPR